MNWYWPPCWLGWVESRNSSRLDRGHRGGCRLSWQRPSGLVKSRNRLSWGWGHLGIDNLRCGKWGEDSGCEGASRWLLRYSVVECTNWERCCPWPSPEARGWSWRRPFRGSYGWNCHHQALLVQLGLRLPTFQAFGVFVSWPLLDLDPIFAQLLGPASNDVLSCGTPTTRIAGLFRRSVS